jgi:hypothetical protein
MAGIFASIGIFKITWVEFLVAIVFRFVTRDQNSDITWPWALVLILALHALANNSRESFAALVARNGVPTVSPLFTPGANHAHRTANQRRMGPRSQFPC